MLSDQPPRCPRSRGGALAASRCESTVPSPPPGWSALAGHRAHQGAILSSRLAALVPTLTASGSLPRVRRCCPRRPAPLSGSRTSTWGWGTPPAPRAGGALCRSSGPCPCTATREALPSHVLLLLGRPWSAPSPPDSRLRWNEAALSTWSTLVTTGRPRGAGGRAGGLEGRWGQPGAGEEGGCAGTQGPQGAAAQGGVPAGGA